MTTEKRLLGFVIGVFFLAAMFAAILLPLTKEPAASLITALILACAVRAWSGQSKSERMSVGS
jgi:hypothetical protein